MGDILVGADLAIFLVLVDKTVGDINGWFMSYMVGILVDNVVRWNPNKHVDSKTFLTPYTKCRMNL